MEINKNKNIVNSNFSNKNTYIISSCSALCFWLALYVFGYYYTYEDTTFVDEITDGGGKNYSISFISIVY